MIKTLFVVGVGSFFGGAFRHYISTIVKNSCNSGFPWGTLAVNLVGCFLFGLIFALFGKLASQASNWCLLFTTGLCGGFTTFSAFANESMSMLGAGNFSWFAAYVAMSVCVGVLLVACGYAVARYMVF